MSNFHITHCAVYLATEPGGNGLWPRVSSPGCWHVGAGLVWLGEDGQAGSENIHGYERPQCKMRTRAFIPAGALRGLWPWICAVPEVRGVLQVLLGEVLMLGRRPDWQVLTVLSGLEIKRPVIGGINVLLRGVLMSELLQERTPLGEPPWVEASRNGSVLQRKKYQHVRSPPLSSQIYSISFYFL